MKRTQPDKMGRTRRSVTKAVMALMVSGLAATAWLAAAPQSLRVDDAALKNAGKTGEEWLTYGFGRHGQTIGPER